MELTEDDVVRELIEHDGHHTDDRDTNPAFSEEEEAEAEAVVAPLTASEERIMRAIRRWALCFEPIPEQYYMPPSPAPPRSPFFHFTVSPTGSSFSFIGSSDDDDVGDLEQLLYDEYDADDEDSLFGEDSLSYYESEDDDFDYDVVGDYSDMGDCSLHHLGNDSDDEDSASFLFYQESDKDEDENEMSDILSQSSNDSAEYVTAIEY